MKIWSGEAQFLRWVGAAAALAGIVAAALSIEPMRFGLPYRYLVRPFDIQREEEGFGTDFAMCMKVRLTPLETQHFISAMFDTPTREGETPVDMAETRCDASFWPKSFRTNAIAHEVDWTPPPIRRNEGSSGAVYEDGYLYFWSNAM